MDFWKDVLSVYAEIHEVDPKTKDQVREQIINNNKYVVIGGKSFYSKELAQKGMDQVGDWFDVQGKIKSFVRVNEIVPSITWWRYNQIVSAIPKSWKQIMKSKKYKYK